MRLKERVFESEQKTVVVSVKLIPPHKVEKESFVWEVFQESTSFRRSLCVTPHIVFERGCVSTSKLMPNGDIYHQLLSYGRLAFDEHGLRIAYDAAVRVNRPGGTDIRVRYNTEQIRDRSVLPWRILTGCDGNFDEIEQVHSVVINGTCYTTSEFLPKIGERKWHVGCCGAVTFTGKGNIHAHITSYQ